MIAAHLKLSRSGITIDTLPRCSGVYRFYDDNNALLYIGKSVDIHSRVAQHFNEGRKPGRHQRLMSQVHHIDCELTAGEIGALLIENAAIKAEVPLFNRRQRRLRKLWTIALAESKSGFLKPLAVDFAPAGVRSVDTFGLFANKHRLISALQDLARDHALCLRVMDLDRGTGPCFQYQLGRCDGACAGEESAASHNNRLRDHLDRQRIAAWPFNGPILLRENNICPAQDQPEEQFHLVDQWAWFGGFSSTNAAAKMLQNAQPATFDRDAYRLIYSAIFRGRVSLVDARLGVEIANPLLAGTRQAS
jgi:excinuclease Cho